MNNREFIDILYKALNSPTQYATGAFGAPTGVKNNTERYASNSADWIAKKIRACPDGTFMFDCIGLAFKAPLWGWSADPTMRYGGAEYKKDGIPDVNLKNIEKYCDYWSTDECRMESLIVPGEILRTPEKNHVGVYVGNGNVIEATSSGDCKVRMIPLHFRDWEGHGTIKYIDYMYDSYQPKKEYKKIGSIVCPHCGVPFEIYGEES